MFKVTSATNDQSTLKRRSSILITGNMSAITGSSSSGRSTHGVSATAGKTYDAGSKTGRLSVGKTTDVYVSFTNAPDPNEKIICGVNCKCLKNLKYATEKAIPGYTYIKYLGAGGFGTVNLYQNNETRGNVAIKEVWSRSSRGKDIYHEVATEYQIVMGINHPNITRYYDFFRIENRHKCYIVMEYAKRGTLRQLIDQQIKLWQLFSQDNILAMIHGVISGVQFLNSKHVVHCDLKPGNILVSENGCLKISDFGTAHFVYDLNAPVINTFRYMAPELFSNFRPDEKTEVWALGIILYELCTLYHPFHPCETNAELVPKIKAGVFKSLNCRVSGYTYGMQELLEYMLQKHREDRKNLSTLLKHALLVRLK